MERLKHEADEFYVGTIIVKGHQCDCYMDDYGQCYYFKYLNEDGEVEEMGCGSYNTDFLECVIGTFDNKGLHYSLGLQDEWEQILQIRKERNLPDIDYDDYEIYDLEYLYGHLIQLE